MANREIRTTIDPMTEPAGPQTSGCPLQIIPNQHLILKSCIRLVLHDLLLLYLTSARGQCWQQTIAREILVTDFQGPNAEAGQSYTAPAIKLI